MNNNSSALDAFESLPKQIQERLIAEERAPIVYSVDDVVSSFLRKHDVFVTPVGSNISASPLTSGLMGSLGGPMAVGMNQALTAQTKGAALQEWTSWKQWALSHPDFKEYKQKAEARAEKYNSEFNAWYDSQEAKDIISAQKKEQKKESRNLRFVLFLIILSPFILSVFIMAGDNLNKRFFAPEAPANLR